MNNQENALANNVTCPRCQLSHIKKNGHTYYDKQNHQCLICVSVITGATFGYPIPRNAAPFVNTYTSGTLLTPINNYLNGDATNLNRRNARYRQPNTFQGPRSVRFGFRLLF